MFFFFKQKTAYEMRISDWSSDVCSSDLKHSKSRAESSGPACGGQCCGGHFGPLSYRFRPMLPASLLTVVVDLIGFGLILTLLTFYARGFGASPFVFALLAAAFSMAQYLAAPMFGALDRTTVAKDKSVSAVVDTGG